MSTQKEVQGKGANFLTAYSHSLLVKAHILSYYLCYWNLSLTSVPSFTGLLTLVQIPQFSRTPPFNAKFNSTLSCGLRRYWVCRVTRVKKSIVGLILQVHLTHLHNKGLFYLFLTLRKNEYSVY